MKSPASLRSDRVATFPGLGGRFHRNTHVPVTETSPGSSTSRRPNFFIVGAPKCGTTSLYNYLKVHPEIFMPDRKEPRYFCDDIGTWESLRIRDEKHYLELFKEAGNEKCIGEASTFYLYSKSAPRKIKDFSSEARIIIMLRHPVDWIHSWHWQMVWNGEQTTIDFEEALAAETTNLHSCVRPKSLPFDLALCYKDLGCFSNFVRPYLEVFGRHRVKVILLEDLVNRPAAMYQETLRFLDVDPNFVPDFQIHNASEKKKFRNLRVRNWFRRHPQVLAFLGHFPTAWASLAGSVLGVFTESHVKQPLPNELAAQFTLGFEDEIRALMLLIDRDLTRWSTRPGK